MNKYALLITTTLCLSTLHAMNDKDKQKALQAFHDAKTKTGKDKEKAENKAREQVEKLVIQGDAGETIFAIHSQLNPVTSTPASTSAPSDSRKKALELAKKRLMEKEKSNGQPSASMQSSDMDTIVPLHHAAVAVSSLERDIKNLTAEINEKKQQYATARLWEGIPLQQEIKKLEKQLHDLRLQQTGAEAKRALYTNIASDKQALKDTINNIVGLLLECAATQRTNSSSVDKQLERLESSLITTYNQLLENHSTSSEDHALKQIQVEFESIASILRSLYRPVTPIQLSTEEKEELEGLQFMAAAAHKEYLATKTRSDEKLYQSCEADVKKFNHGLEQKHHLEQQAESRTRLLHDLQQAAARLKNINL